MSTQDVSVRPGQVPEDGAAAALLPAAPRPTLRTILKLALAQSLPWPESGTLSFAEMASALAPALTAELARNGYRIHDTRLCVRVPDVAKLGRPMTDAERAELPATDQPLPHPRRRP